MTSSGQFVDLPPIQRLEQVQSWRRWRYAEPDAQTLDIAGPNFHSANAACFLARQIGCDLAIALTEPGSSSQRSYHNAGFQLAYTRAIMIKHLPGR
jgi:hypothetical protein